jgi:hypothetical protein
VNGQPIRKPSITPSWPSRRPRALRIRRNCKTPSRKNWSAAKSSPRKPRKRARQEPNIQGQIELAKQAVLIRAYLSDYVKAHPISDAQLKAEYDVIKNNLGSTEYKARHVLVEKEEEAKAIIAKLDKGEKFSELAKQSKDPGSKDKGGELGWSSPAAYVKPFGEALTKLKKGEYTKTPVQSDFGYHVIQLDDSRPANPPPFDQVKPQLQQRASQQQIEIWSRNCAARPRWTKARPACENRHLRVAECPPSVGIFIARSHVQQAEKLFDKTADSACAACRQHPGGRPRPPFLRREAVFGRDNRIAGHLFSVQQSSILADANADTTRPRPDPARHPECQPGCLEPSPAVLPLSSASLDSPALDRLKGDNVTLLLQLAADAEADLVCESIDQLRQRGLRFGLFRQPTHPAYAKVIQKVDFAAIDVANSEADAIRNFSAAVRAGQRQPDSPVRLQCGYGRRSSILPAVAFRPLPRQVRRARRRCCQRAVRRPAQDAVAQPAAPRSGRCRDGRDRCRDEAGPGAQLPHPALPQLARPGPDPPDRIARPGTDHSRPAAPDPLAGRAALLGPRAAAQRLAAGRERIDPRPADGSARAQLLPGQPHDPLFLTGIFSCLDRLLRRPLAEVLGTMPIADEIRLALLERQGPYAALLAVAEASENVDQAGMAGLARAAGVDPDRLNRALLAATAWASEVTEYWE